MTSSESSFMSEAECEEDRDIAEKAHDIKRQLLPKKFSSQYQLCYKDFIEWKNKNKTIELTEDVFLAYFDELSKKMKPLTLWSRWSMLTKVVYLNHGIDTNNFQRLKSFMKIRSKEFRSKKS